MAESLTGLFSTVIARLAAAGRRRLSNKRDKRTHNRTILAFGVAAAVNASSRKMENVQFGLSGSLPTLVFLTICNLACTDAELSSSLNLSG
jgi:hypothetical protein